MTYYDKQFSKLNNNHAYLKLMGDSGETFWITITPQQIKAILEILNKAEADA